MKTVLGLLEKKSAEVRRHYCLSDYDSLSHAVVQTVTYVQERPEIIDALLRHLSTPAIMVSSLSCTPSLPEHRM